MRAISDTLYFESKIQTLNSTSKILFIKRRLFLFNGYLEAVALNIQGGDKFGADFLESSKNYRENWKWAI